MSAAGGLVARLAASGIDPQLLADVAEQLFTAEVELAALASRRKNERERKAKSREVTGQAVTDGDTPSPFAPPKKAPEPQKITPPISPNPEDSSAAADASLRPEHVFEFYQELAAELGLAVPRDFTPERRQLTRGRVAQYPLEDFQTVIARCRGSPFLRGDRGRTPLTFDWLMKKGNFQKVLEGNYES